MRIERARGDLVEQQGLGLRIRSELGGPRRRLGASGLPVTTGALAHLVGEYRGAGGRTASELLTSQNRSPQATLTAQSRAELF